MVAPVPDGRPLAEGRAAGRASVVTTIDEALTTVRSGMTVAIGGFINSCHPMLAVRGIIRRGLTDLTIIGGASAGLELDLLIAAGCVRKVIAPYVGGEMLAPIGPAFRAAAEAGRLDVFELDEAHYYCGLRAAAQQVPFYPSKAGVGTSLPEVNPALKLFQDPIGGETLVAVPAFRIDVAFLHAAHADCFGNIQPVGHGFGDRAIWAAADRCFVQVEKLIPNEEVRQQPIRTTIPRVDGVIRAPFGAHPFASPGYYLEDRAHIRLYVEAATAWAKTGDDAPLRAYLDRFVRGPEDHVAYLEAIGLRALLQLNEY